MYPNRFCAIYAIFVGVMMGAMWTVFLLTGQVPELETAFWSIALHLAAEFATALILIIGGSAALARRPWAGSLLLFGLGMLIYTLIQSPGYYIELGQPAFVAMFAALAVPAVLCATRLIRR